MNENIVLNKDIITKEVFDILQGGGVIHITPAKYYPEWNHIEPTTVALCDENDCFLDWLA